MFAFRNQILGDICAIQEQEQAEEQVPRPIRRRTSVYREHGVAHQRLFEDYFADEPRWGPTVFSPSLRIVHAMEAPRRVLPAAARCGQQNRSIPAYEVHGCASSVGLWHYNGHVRRISSRQRYNWGECLAKFYEGVVDAFRATYLRKPNAEDCQFLMRMHDRVHDSTGMLGSIDCMHWEWKNCLAEWRGQFTSGYKGTHTTIILEAIVGHRLWIWQAHFGVAISPTMKLNRG
ncbi:uncharacterized protein LOC121774280 [Salvia splendens]|uniref:uncharacterized protein LOC121774280 n=1 Tax=Salvia splendens TaxID=180675 RepID=UPI001C27CA9D|nr:uncharacterized protein LOC121774280 [Salvia splendens]